MLTVVRSADQSGSREEDRDRIIQGGEFLRVEVWASDGFYCPRCNARAASVPFHKRKLHYCLCCEMGYHCRSTPGGILVSSAIVPIKDSTEDHGS